MSWLTRLDENPFAPALERNQDRHASVPDKVPSPVPSPLGKEVQRSEGVSVTDAREKAKMASTIAAFERMEEAAKRRKRAAQLKQEREQSDPCKCGHARARRLPKPLAPGGPRCARCTPLPARPEGQSCGLQIVDAPLFCPTEEEFRNPMEYIRKIQKEAQVLTDTHTHTYKHTYTHALSYIHTARAHGHGHAPDRAHMHTHSAPNGIASACTYARGLLHTSHPLAQAYGIFRIQPPGSWKPPKAFHRHRDADNFAGTQPCSSPSMRTTGTRPALPRPSPPHAGIAPAATQLDSARLNSARLGSARLGSARLDSARLDSARLGPTRFDLCLQLSPPALLTPPPVKMDMASSRAHTTHAELAGGSCPRHPWPMEQGCHAEVKMCTRVATGWSQGMCLVLARSPEWCTC